MSPAKPTPKRPVPVPSRTTSQAPEIVDPRWILRAVGAIVAIGLLCAYVTLCAFFYHGQWQLVLHPSRIVDRTPASLGLAFEPVRFGTDTSGQPQLSGWWVPDESATSPTVLLLHSQDGSMSTAVSEVQALHNARLNVLVFDYRGYGQSAGTHPTQQKMQADAESALNYLTGARHVPAPSVLVYATGLAASLGVNLCAHHGELAGLMLESADGDTESRILQDVRSRVLPISSLFRERFPLADPLSRLHTPKLLISYTKGSAPLEAERAAPPKLTVELPPNASSEALTAAIVRFPGIYVPRSPAVLIPQAGSH